MQIDLGDPPIAQRAVVAAWPLAVLAEPEPSHDRRRLMPTIPDRYQRQLDRMFAPADGDDCAGYGG